MPVFAYKGFDASGKPASGMRDADSQRAIKQLLRKDGIYITELVERQGAAHIAHEKKRLQITLKALTERVSSQDIAVATRQLATLVHAGIPLVDGLGALIDQVDNQLLKETWADVRRRVNEGSSFADALAASPKIFSGLYINMVRAGESSGALEVVLERLADFTESQAELRSRLIGTMIYPILMIMMATVVTGILFTFVIPKIAKIFQAQKVALPLPTMVLMGTAEFVRDYGIIVFPLLILGLFLLQRYLKTPIGKTKWDKFILKAPLFGPLVRQIAIVRFSKTLATLVGSGVPLLAAFDIVKTVVQNDVLAKVIDTARDAVSEGESIAAPLKRSGEFPPIVTHMIAVGEKSGQLESMLDNVARSYDVQVKARLQAMTSLLEPILIVFLGIVVAGIVFAILLPMLRLSSFAR